jgi:hypothetical protein
MTIAPCLLCDVESELQLSHVLPAFVYRWLKESSGNGHIRSSAEPNKRVQDGLKFNWLCTSCEMRLSRSEGLFAEKLFYPYIEDSGKVVQYSNWLLYFCTSVSWRVLRYYKQNSHLNDLPIEKLKQIEEADSTWKEFLLGRAKHPGNFQQHLLPVDQISSSTGSMAPNINRYLMRAIHIDFCQGNKSIFTYAKLGRFIIIGFVHEPNPNHWKGTKVHVHEGTVGPRQYVLPIAFGDYLNEKASSLHETLGCISEKQQKKIDIAFRANIENYTSSDAFVAMNADVEMFGSQAFSSRGKKSVQ